MPAELDAFSADPGADAGRIEPRAADVGIRLDGSWLFCLGHDAPGFTALLKPGDYAEISQTGDFTGFKVLTFQPRTRAPATTPLGYSWIASILIDGVIVSQRTIGSGQTPNDWAAWIVNISKVSAGNHALAFRLTFSGPALPPAPASPLIEAEVPAFYVEKIALVTATGPLILNQIPDPGAGTHQAPSTPIDFDIVDLGANGIDTATINVTINSIAAIVNGVAQTGYSATITSIGDTAHVRMTPNAPYDSASTVHVSVAAQTLSTHIPLNPNPTTWNFIVADNIPPVIADATARDTKTIRVTWNEAVLAATAFGANDALNPARYALRPTVPVGGIIAAVTPNVLSVSPLSSTQFDLTTDIDCSPGVQYALTAEGVNDLSGNNTITVADFTGFSYPDPEGRDFDLLKWLPLMNRQEDLVGSQDLRRFVSCLQEIARLLLWDIDRWSTILDVDIAPEAFVDAMLAELGNPFPFALSLTDKRRLAHILIAIYQQKGTPDGIVDTVRFFMGLDITITAYDGEGLILGLSQLGVDWILGPGTSFARYSFRIVAQIILSATQLAQLTFLANYMKPAHTHLIEVVQPFPPPVYDPIELGVSRLGDDWLLH